MYKRRAFTLIELLVVIAIIAILMSILMPALNRVKKQGRHVACIDYLKQLALVWIMYTDDNDDKIVQGTQLNAEIENGYRFSGCERSWPGTQSIKFVEYTTLSIIKVQALFAKRISIFSEHISFFWTLRPQFEHKQKNFFFQLALPKDANEQNKENQLMFCKRSQALYPSTFIRIPKNDALIFGLQELQI